MSGFAPFYPRVSARPSGKIKVGRGEYGVAARQGGSRRPSLENTPFGRYFPPSSRRESLDLIQGPCPRRPSTTNGGTQALNRAGARPAIMPDRFRRGPLTRSRDSDGFARTASRLRAGRRKGGKFERKSNRVPESRLVSPRRMHVITVDMRASTLVNNELQEITIIYIKYKNKTRKY